MDLSVIDKDFGDNADLLSVPINGLPDIVSMRKPAHTNLFYNKPACKEFVQEPFRLNDLSQKIWLLDGESR